MFQMARNFGNKFPKEMAEIMDHLFQQQKSRQTVQ